MGSCFVLVYGILVFSSVFKSKIWQSMTLSDLWYEKSHTLSDLWFEQSHTLSDLWFEKRTLPTQQYDHHTSLIGKENDSLISLIWKENDSLIRSWSWVDVELSLRSNRDLFNSMIITNGPCVVFFSKKRPIHQHNLGQKWTLSFLCALQEIYIRIWSWV